MLTYRRPPNKLNGEYKLNHMKMIRRGKAFIEKEDPPLAKLMQSTQQAAIQLTLMGRRTNGEEYEREG